jgi:hypothetical protein
MKDEVSPRLERIKGYSAWLRDDADNIAFNVKTLPLQPEFQTEAQAVLVEAKQHLETALAQVNQSLADFAAKPVEHTNAA